MEAYFMGDVEEVTPEEASIVLYMDDEDNVVHVAPVQHENSRTSVLSKWHGSSEVIEHSPVYMPVPEAVRAIWLTKPE